MMMMGLEVLVLVGVVIAVVWGVRQVWNPVGRVENQHAGSALEILEQRFARGEIDPQEFEQRRAFLEGQRTVAG